MKTIPQPKHHHKFFTISSIFKIITKTSFLLLVLLLITSCIQTQNKPYYSVLQTHKHLDATGGSSVKHNNYTVTTIDAESLETIEADLFKLDAHTNEAVAYQNKAYYSQSVQNGEYQLEQLFCLDEKNVATQLTTTLAYIHSIIPYHDKIVVVALPKGADVVKIYLYDEKDHTLSELSAEMNYHCYMASYNPLSDTILFVTHEYEEYRNSLITKQIDNENVELPATTYFYTLNEQNELELCLTQEQFEVVNFAAGTDHDIYFNGYRKMLIYPLSYEYETEYYHYSYKTQQYIDTEAVFEELNFLVRNKYYYLDENTIVFLGIENSEEPNGTSMCGIYQYNKQTKQLDRIIEIDTDEGQTLAFQLLQ